MQCHRPSDHGTELQPLQPLQPVRRAKGQNYLKGTAIGDASYFGPELEHFVFNEVRYDQSTNYGYYEIDAIEANWNAAKKNGPSLGHKLRPKEGYFPVPPADLLQDARTNMVSILKEIGRAESGISRSPPLLLRFLSGYTTQTDADPRRTEPHRNEVPWPGIIAHRRTHGSVNRHLQKPSFGTWPKMPWRAGVNRSPERQPGTTTARAAVTRKQSRRIGLGAPAAAPASEGQKGRAGTSAAQVRRRLPGVAEPALALTQRRAGTTPCPGPFVRYPFVLLVVRGRPKSLARSCPTTGARLHPRNGRHW
jgi:hypothetical protein